jgi:hypothetical protein
MAFAYNDGGRKAAGFKGSANDCSTRAIAIATGKPYAEVYKSLTDLERAKAARSRKSRGRPVSARTGISMGTLKLYLSSLGWKWKATMGIGTGTTVTLCEEDLPMGRIIVRVSGHIAAIIDRVVNDTGDCQRDFIMHEDGVNRIMRRCVYGYWERA